MFIIISYVNLLILMIISMGHMILSMLYHDQCPASPYLSKVLIITGISGFLLSIICLLALFYHQSKRWKKWNLICTYILLIYLIISRIFISIMALQLASRRPQEILCSPILYWGSTLMILASYSVVIITGCVLINLIVSQRSHAKNKKKKFSLRIEST